MTHADDPTPFFRRRRNVVTAMVFLELLIFPSFVHVNIFNTATSFAFGYLVTQLFGAIVVMKFGGHQLVFCAVFSSSLFQFVIPTIRNLLYGSPALIATIVLGLLQGAVQGIIMPSFLVIWSKWLPPLERSRTIGFALCGTYLGYSFKNPMLIQDFGSLYVDAYYYVLGAAGLVWAIVWKYFVRNSPEMDPRITFREKDFIRITLAGQATFKNVPIPWTSIFSSTAVLAIIVATFVQDWAGFTLKHEIINFSMNQRIIQSELDIVVAVSMLTAGFVIHAAQKKIASLTTGRIRRQLVCISFIIQIICMYIAFAYGLDSKNTSLIFKLIGLVFASLVHVCIIVNYVDIAPHFAGVLFGICNTLVGLLGFIRLWTIAFVNYEDFGTSERPTAYAAIVACLLSAGAVVYWFFGQTDIQKWAVQEIVIYQT